MLGGFPRRATVLADLKPDLLFDAGDLISQASPYDLLKLRLMLALDGYLGYAAVNVGRREAEFSRDELVKVAAESPVPLISSNLADEVGKPLLPGHVVLERGGRRIAVVGLVTTGASRGAGLTILDPAEALRRELAAVRSNVDFVIVLAALPAAEISKALAAAPGVDLILGGIVPKASEKLEAIVGVPCFLVQGKGQYFGDLVLREDGGKLRPASGQRVVLGPEVVADTEIEKSIRAFELSLKDLDLLGKSEAKSPFIGSRSCAACHEEAFAKWQSTGHARALSALRPSLVLNHFLHAGRYYDEETGFYWNRMRTYDPDTGTSLQRDAADPLSTCNLYQYSVSRPTSLRDPLGLDPLDDALRERPPNLSAGPPPPDRCGRCPKTAPRKSDITDLWCYHPIGSRYHSSPGNRRMVFRGLGSNTKVECVYNEDSSFAWPAGDRNAPYGEYNCGCCRGGFRRAAFHLLIDVALDTIRTYPDPKR